MQSPLRRVASRLWIMLVLTPYRVLRRYGRQLARQAGRRFARYRKVWRRRAYQQWNKRNRRTYTERLELVPARDELPELLNRRGLTRTGAEIGVKAGKFSAWLLTEWKGSRLISIDPWLEDAPDAYVDTANVPQDQHERFYEETKARLAPFGKRSEIWRLTSVDAAAQVADGSLDFAYIDARHDYESVLEDLEAWFPKVRAGGIFAGHDYATGHFPQGDFGVKKAVDEFFAARSIPVHATDGRYPVEMFPTWIVEIPASASPAGDSAASSREGAAATG
ncbi:MAG TPA: class I SAM-dependent methyltransferase [Thermoleophilaceae bacterium]